MDSRTFSIGAVGLAALLATTPQGTGLAQGRQISPRDTSRVTIGGAKILVDYGRPSKRGRQIFGGLVPYGQVWRTGANQATHLITEMPLSIGSLSLPAGAYTLFTVPDRNGWTLIINKQTGQWGTDYDQGMDLGRIDMKVEELPGLVEQLTIKLVPKAGRAGALRIEWDRTAATTPFTVAQ